MIPTFIFTEEFESCMNKQNKRCGTYL